MSGGHYDYAYSRVRDLAESIREDVTKHSVPPAYPIPVREAMSRCRLALEDAADAARDVEWFMSGDDGEETFLEAVREWKIPDYAKRS